MSKLSVWLPLTKTLKQQGLNDMEVVNHGAIRSDGNNLGMCFLCDGVDDYISGTYEATANITFAAWVCFPTVPAGRHVFDARTSAGVGYQPMYLTATSIQYGCSGSAYETVNYTWTANTWYHICVTHSSTKGTLYINGQQQKESTTTKGVGLGTCNFTLGSKYNQSNYSNVKFNDVRIYNTTLNSTEVERLAAGMILDYPLENDGFAGENLFRWSACNPSEIGTLIGNGEAAYWNKYMRFYNGNASLHNFHDGMDTITLNSTGNLGISFVRKATDIALDSNSYYTISCEAKSSQTAQPLCIGLSYYTTANGWIWRGGENPQNFSTANVWKKFTFTFKPDADTQYINYCFTVYSAAASSETFSIRNCKLEKGSTASTWIPNKEDWLGKAMNLDSTVIHDLGGHNYNAKSQNIIWTHEVPNIYYKGSASFDTGSYIYLDDPPSLVGQANATIAAWVYPTARQSVSDRDCILIYKNLYLTIDPTGHLAVYAYGKTPAGYHVSDATIPLNTWTHIAAVWSGSYLCLVINGAIDTVIQDCPGTFTDVAWNRAHIGAEADYRDGYVTLNRQFKGNICGVRVFSTGILGDDDSDTTFMNWVKNNLDYLNIM